MRKDRPKRIPSFETCGSPEGGTISSSHTNSYLESSQSQEQNVDQ